MEEMTESGMILLKRFYYSAKGGQIGDALGRALDKLCQLAGGQGFEKGAGTGARARPATRGELRDKLRDGVACEVAAHVAGMTTTMLRGWLGFNAFTVRPSDNAGWVLFEPKNDSLLATIKRYGEACENYGLANPCNPSQCNRLACEKEFWWAKVVDAVPRGSEPHGSQEKL